MANTERFETELPLDLAQFVHSQVGQGALATDSDVLREAVRALQREANQVGEMRVAWGQGVASGDAGPLDFSELHAEARRRLAHNSKESRGADTPHRPRP